MKRLLILFLLLAVGCNNRQQADNANQMSENNALPWQNVSDSLGSGYDKSNINVYVNTEHPGVSVSKIYYKSTDGSIIQPNKDALFDARIVSNTYEDGVGVICFDGPITVIDREAFYNKDVLSSIIIPNGVTEIGEEAFYGCDNLTGITIPNSVTSIGDSAFWGCKNLKSITIPNSVASIGEWAFGDCGNLKRFYGKFATPDGKALIDNGRLISYAHGNNAESYTIPNSVTSIGEGAFRGCENLTSITIPNSVTTIGGNAFRDCENLKEVYCKAITPPDMRYGYGTEGWWDAFVSNAPDRKIYVPRKSVEAYKSADGWTNYDYAIVGYDF